MSGVLMTKSGWNQSQHVEAIGLRSVARRKKERKKEETSKIQYPAGVSGRVIFDQKKSKKSVFLDKNKNFGSFFLVFWKI